MAVASSLSTANTFPHLSSSKSSLSSSSLTSTSSLSSPFYLNIRTHLLVPFCKSRETELPFSSSSSSSSSICLSKRNLALSLSSAFLLSLAGKRGDRVEAAPLEDEDDLELLEKVKQDRKKRLERQAIINSYTKEKGYLQDLVYQLSKVGQAIESNDLNAASSVLGATTDTDWIKKANSAFTKLSSTSEEKEEVEVFNTSISKLISYVTQQDAESSKIAFVSSASAFEKWTELTGLNGLLKGL
ncbi:Thylakoid lumenal 16.5 kDa protein chloroplastic [Bienertia sinuspersici]